MNSEGSVDPSGLEEGKAGVKEKEEQREDRTPHFPALNTWTDLCCIELGSAGPTWV
jgi:hypothetical protein